MPKTPEEVGLIKAVCGDKLNNIFATLNQVNPNPTREEALEIVQQWRNPLYDLALAARGIANSYRNFDVGTVSIGLRPIMTPGASAWLLRFAANTKEENGEKYCGEQRLLDTALRKRISHIIAFFVAAEPQEDHGSGKKGRTLTPCEVCRWRMRGLMREREPIIQPDTLVCTIHCHEPAVREMMSIAGLHAFHCESLP